MIIFIKFLIGQKEGNSNYCMFKLNGVYEK